MAREDRILEAINDLSEWELIELWNAYQREICGEDDVYEMSDFDDIMRSDSPIEIANKIHFGEFSPMDAYFWFNGYANLVSGMATDAPIYKDDIAHYMADCNNDLWSYIGYNEEDFDEAEDEEE